MPGFLRCPQGHQWKARPDKETHADQPPTCPVCGASGESAPGPAAWNAEASTIPPGGPVVPPEVRKPSLAGYEILDELGRGGMGVVYKARQVALQRLVALKMILAGSHAGPKQLARFRAEAEAVARLQHPNIVHIYEVGEQDGLAFFSLEFIEGGNLAQKLNGRPLPFRESAGLICTLAGTIDYAHRRGIIHRDLKPPNILLTADGIPKITDFGLAKQLSTGTGTVDDPSSGSHTQTGSVIGTPSYMAPEQAGGKGQEVGPAADIYALGAILYEMLTGRPPFRAESPLDTVLQVISEEPVPPRRLSPRVPRDLETICLKCLEKEPRRRFRSAGELAEELTRFLKDEPIHAHPISTSVRLWRWCKRNPTLATTGSVAMAALLAVFFLSVFFGITRSYHATRLQTILARSDRLLVDLSFEKATALCEEGDVPRGLLWFAQTLKSCPEDAFDLQRTIRINLSDWRLQMRPLRALIGPSAPITSVAFGDGGRLLTLNAEHRLSIWDPNTGLCVAASPPADTALLPLVVSRDGRRVLTGSTDNQVRLWDCRRQAENEAGAPPSELHALVLPHPAPVHAAAFSSDGKTVLTGCQDGGARLWDGATGEPHGPVLKHGGPVEAVAFAPDGKAVWTGSADRKARLWDLATGAARIVLEHEGNVQRIALAPNGKALLTLVGGNQTQLWDAEAGVRIGRLRQRYPVRAIAFSPDSTMVATGGEDQAVQLWRVATAEPLGKPLQHQDWVQTIAFRSDSKTLLTGSSDRTARFWDVATGQPVGPPLEHPGAVLSAAFSPDGRSVLTGCADHAARVWDASPGERLRYQFPHPDQVLAVAFRPDGKVALTGCGDHRARYWDLQDGSPRGPVLTHRDEIWAVAFSPDGEAVVTGSKDETARLWDGATGRPLGHPLQLQHWVRAVAFSPDGRTILTGSGDQRAGTAQLWERTTNSPVGPPLTQAGAVWAVAFSPDGATAVTADGDDQAQLWDLTTGKPLGAPLVHQARVVAAAFSPDGRLLITGSTDRTARLWDTVTRMPFGEPLRHRGGVWDVAFSPDGKTVLTGCRDCGARLWDVATGKPLGAVLPHDGVVWAVAFSPDGRSVLTGSGDYKARLWSLPAPMEGTVEQIQRWAQVISGMELDNTGAIHVLDAGSWQERKQLLEDLTGPAFP
jgi:WD40 repeat protein/serine/threonine protein kinase